MLRSRVAMLLSAALSLGANATSEHAHYHGTNGVTHVDKDIVTPLIKLVTSNNAIQGLTPVKQVKALVSSKAVTDQIIPVTCEPSEFASYSGNDFVEYVSNAYLQNEVQAGYDCFRPISVKFDEDSIVFSADNITNVANAIVTELDSGNYIPERIFGKLFYLRVMYYNYMVQGGAHSIPADESSIKAALDAIFAEFDGDTTDETHQIIIAEAVVAAGSYYTHFDFMGVDDGGVRVAQLPELVPIMISRLDIIRDKFTAPNEENQYGIYRAANAIISEYNRVVRYYIGEEVHTNTEMPSVLAQYIYNINVDDPVPSNAIYALLAMAQFGITDEIVSAVQEVLDETGKFSESHIALLKTISDYNLDCTAFDRDSLLCASDELTAEMHDYALPNTFQFGDITFITKMTEERTRHIFNSLQATRSRFFRETGITEAVENDPNENATFVLYGSPDDYRTFQPYLYNIDANNGGIYIEQQGTLFSFDRPDTEMFVLEELARHEYVHYLNGRYLTPGMWGEGEFFENDRYTWFDEGFANYLTGANQATGPTPLQTMIEMKGWYSNRSVSEIVSAAYGDDWMYPYTALLFNYFNHIGSDAIVDLAAAIRTEDGSEFDSVESTLVGMDAGFQTYIYGLTTDGWEAPWFAYREGANLEADGVIDIQIALTDAMGYATTCLEVDEENFTCSFSIEAVGTKHAQTEIVNTVLDIGITLVLTQGVNNFETMTCHPTSFTSSNVYAECIGLLRPDHIEYENKDSDGDGYPDNIDAFPNDPNEWEDTDGDGYGDNQADAFPNDPAEWADSDGDGYGDNHADAFPNDPNEWKDTDGDGVGDNGDAFPNDPTETKDSDGDGVGDNSDAFPNDATEWLDSDGDGYGDNSDAFPNDSTEWLDSDGDGYGDNSDAYPNDASLWQQSSNTGTDGSNNSNGETESKSSGGSFGFISGLFMLALLTIRKRKITKS